ncbi:MAG: hypothetical protein AAB859_01865 [Patescibacteria group bacterium]
MDTTQLLLSTAVTITTILLIVVSVQLISLLKQLKKDHGKEVHPAVKITEAKKDKVTKKRINLTTLLEKMKTHISHPHLSKKKFFKS